MSTTTKPVSLEQEIADRFKRDTADHVMTVLHDDGLYRHIRCARPERSWNAWFEVITWPGSLAIKGDMGGAYIFSRLDDMFEFFRSGGSSHGINPGYWAEKLVDGGRSVQAYSEDVLKEHIEDQLKEYAEGYADQVADYARAKEVYDGLPLLERVTRPAPVQPRSVAEIRALIARCDEDGELSHPDGARELLRDLELAGVCSDTWEWNLTGWDWSFLWACHAIVWAIAQYDAAKTEAESTEWLVWSNHYRAWWGPKGAGYFGDITKAGRYTRDEAIECAGRRSWISDNQPPEVIIPAPPAPMMTGSVDLTRYIKEQIETATRAAVEAGRTTAPSAPSAAPTAGLITTVELDGVSR